MNSYSGSPAFRRARDGPAKAIAHLRDLDAEFDERSAVRGLRANSAAREDMLYQLDHARKLVAALERYASNISCLSYHDGGEVLIDMHEARTWCHLVEAKIMRVCGDDSGAGGTRWTIR